MTDRDDPETGRVILGRYRIIRLLARGGMGTVHLARIEGAAGFSKPVVIKRILPQLTGVTDEQTHFIREARILAQLRHPGIVDVVDFGREGGAYLMVLEYVPGHHLGQWLKYVTRGSAKMPWDIAVCLMIQVLTALHYAHTFTRSDGVRATIVHRDISPSNILIDIDGNVRLVDFGIASIDAGPVDQDVTIKGEFRGKLPYAAPEQLYCEAATPSSDTYSCAVVLYQLLAGENPFSAPVPHQIIQRVLKLVPAAIDTRRDDVPAELGQVLSRALAKESELRYASAQEFASALRALLPEPEAQISERLVAAVRADFLEGVPRALNVPSVSELEAAWRRASGYPPAPAVASLPTIRVQGTNPLPVILDASTLAQQKATRPAAATRSASRWLLSGVVAAVILASIAVIVALRGTPATNAAPRPRFVVVESNHSDRSRGATPSISDTDTIDASAMASAEPTPSAEQPKPGLSNEGRGPSTHSIAASTKPRNPSGGLSRTFANRQGDIQRCFHANALAVQGAPQITIRFSIDERGKVLAATVQPVAVAGTALGQCLASVARTTSFGPQDGPLAFSIPITARVQ